MFTISECIDMPSIPLRTGHKVPAFLVVDIATSLQFCDNFFRPFGEAKCARDRKQFEKFPVGQSGKVLIYHPFHSLSLHFA